LADPGPGGEDDGQHGSKNHGKRERRDINRPRGSSKKSGMKKKTLWRGKTQGRALRQRTGLQVKRKKSGDPAVKRRDDLNEGPATKGKYLAKQNSLEGFPR